MKLDSPDKLMVSMACICTCFFFLENASTMPAWKLYFFIASCITYCWLAIKIWLVKEIA